MNAENVFTLANIIFTVGTLLLFAKVVKNRNILNDFSLSGSVLTTVGMVFSIIGYSMLEMYTPVIFAIPTMSFWGYVSFYTIKKKLVKKEKVRTIEGDVR